MIYTTHPDLPFTPVTYLDTPRLTGGQRRDSWVGYSVDPAIIRASLDKYHVAGQMVIVDHEKQPGWTSTAAEREAYAAVHYAMARVIDEHVPGVHIASYGIPRLDINGRAEWLKASNTPARKQKYARRLDEASKINATYGRRRDAKGRYISDGLLNRIQTLSPQLYARTVTPELAENIAEAIANLNRSVIPTIWLSYYATPDDLRILLEPLAGVVHSAIAFERHDFTPPADYGDRLDVLREFSDGVH